APGQGSPTPVPPSASQPLPAENPAPAGQGALATTTPPVADMSGQRTDGARLAMPVDGRIIRAYARGRNDGIGIGAPAGAQVRAAAAGTVAAITQDADQVPILVVRHDNNLLTVYANIDDIRVERGARVTRGQNLATVRQGDPSFLHFEVREGFESVDPMPYLQ
ncbi:MAG TPA: M23 family metallopeptidase, partial [Paracoccus sp.]|nr:M23 family metallopeptidase [Paracoccus sp. (in: a-proteobacteria)]